MITTCVILNYNDSETTLSLLNCIKNYDELDYIVVVDNKSTDNSYQILKTMESKKIHVLLSDYNGGYGYGNNLGIRYSYYKLNADYTLIVNPDVFFTNECVYKLRKALINNKECAISAATPIKPNGERYKVIAWKLPTVKEEVFGSSIILNKLIGLSPAYKEEYFKNKKTCYVEVVQGAMLMVDTELMIKYGMYDEDFFLYCEEQVLAQKFKQHGLKSILLLDESYIHNHSVSINKSYKTLIKRRKLMYKSKLLYLKKYKDLKGMLYYLIFVFYNITLIEMWFMMIIKKIKKGLCKLKMKK